MRPRTADRGFPASLAVPAALGVALLVLPLVALLARVEWSTILVDLTAPQALDALRLSLVTALAATALCVVLGVPLGLVIARARPRVAAALRIAVAVPLVLPPMVGGVALLYLLGRRGLIGGPLFDAWGVQLPFTTPAVVLAQTFVALPFLVLTFEAAVRAIGTDVERTAETLGAGRWRVLWQVTLPLAAPGLVAGVALCFARAIGEFGATALFAGNAPGVTQTMPLAIYAAFNGSGVGREQGLALALMLLVAAIAVLVFVRGWRPGATR